MSRVELITRTNEGLEFDTILARVILLLHFANIVESVA